MINRTPFIHSLARLHRRAPSEREAVHPEAKDLLVHHQE